MSKNDFKNTPLAGEDIDEISSVTVPESTRPSRLGLGTTSGVAAPELPSRVVSELTTPGGSPPAASSARASRASAARSWGPGSGEGISSDPHGAEGSGEGSGAEGSVGRSLTSEEIAFILGGCKLLSQKQLSKLRTGQLFLLAWLIDNSISTRGEFYWNHVKELREQLRGIASRWARFGITMRFKCIAWSSNASTQVLRAFPAGTLNITERAGGSRLTDLISQASRSRSRSRDGLGGETDPTTVFYGDRFHLREFFAADAPSIMIITTDGELQRFNPRTVGSVSLPKRPDAANLLREFSAFMAGEHLPGGGHVVGFRMVDAPQLSLTLQMVGRAANYSVAAPFANYVDVYVVHNDKPCPRLTTDAEDRVIVDTILELVKTDVAGAYKLFLENLDAVQRRIRVSCMGHTEEELRKFKLALQVLKSEHERRQAGRTGDLAANPIDSLMEFLRGGIDLTQDQQALLIRLIWLARYQPEALGGGRVAFNDRDPEHVLNLLIEYAQGKLARDFMGDVSTRMERAAAKAPTITELALPGTSSEAPVDPRLSGALALVFIRRPTEPEDPTPVLKQLEPELRNRLMSSPLDLVHSEEALDALARMGKFATVPLGEITEGMEVLCVLPEEPLPEELARRVREWCNHNLYRLLSGGAITGLPILWHLAIWHLTRQEHELFGDVDLASLTRHLRSSIWEAPCSMSMNGLPDFITTRVATILALWFTLHARMLGASLPDMGKYDPMPNHIEHAELLVNALQLLADVEVDERCLRQIARMQLVYWLREVRAREIPPDVKLALELLPWAAVCRFACGVPTVVPRSGPIPSELFDRAGVPEKLRLMFHTDGPWIFETFSKVDGRKFSEQRRVDYLAEVEPVSISNPWCYPVVGKDTELVQSLSSHGQSGPGWSVEASRHYGGCVKVSGGVVGEGGDILSLNNLFRNFLIKFSRFPKSVAEFALFAWRQSGCVPMPAHFELACHAVWLENRMLGFHELPGDYVAELLTKSMYPTVRGRMDALTRPVGGMGDPQEMTLAEIREALDALGPVEVQFRRLMSDEVTEELLRSSHPRARHWWASFQLIRSDFLRESVDPEIRRLASDFVHLPLEDQSGGGEGGEEV